MTIQALNGFSLTSKACGSLRFDVLSSPEEFGPFASEGAHYSVSQALAHAKELISKGYYIRIVDCVVGYCVAKG